MKFLYTIMVLIVAASTEATTFYFDTNTNYIDFRAVPLTTWSVNGHTAWQLNPSQSIRFASQSSGIAINSFVSSLAGRNYVLYQDGVIITNVALPLTPDSTVVSVLLATNLNTSSVHEYEIVCATPISGSVGNWFETSLELDSLASVAHPQRFMWGFYGDSITAIYPSCHMTDISSPLITNTIYGDEWIFTHAVGAAMSIVGTPGGKVNTALRDATGNINTNVDGVFVQAGVNDLPDLPSGSNAFRTAYATMVTNIHVQIGAGKPVICLQPQPVSSGSQRALAGQLIQEAITGQSKTWYYSTDTYYPDTTATYLPDSTHPNAAGYSNSALAKLVIYTAYTNSLPPVTNPPSSSVIYYMPFRR